MTVSDAVAEPRTGARLDDAGAPGPRWYRPGLAGVLAAALVVRLANVLVWRPTCDLDLVDVARAGGPGAGFRPSGGQDGCFAIWGDTAYSYLQGRLMAEGHWFVDGYRWFLSGGTALQPSAGDPPLFSLYLAALARAGLSSGTAMRAATALVGTAGVLAIVLLARHLAGPRAALTAGGIAAVYPMLWINDGMLMSESLYVPALAVALLAAYRFAAEPSWRSALVLGALVGIAALVRAEALLLLVAIPVPLLWRAVRAGDIDRRRAGGAGLAVAGAGALVLAPWIAYNVTRFERPAYMTAVPGAVLSSGNCDRTYGGELIGYYATCFEDHVASGGAVDGRRPCRPGEPAGAGCWADDPGADETVRDRYRLDYAVTYMGDHAARLPVVMAARVGRIVDLYVPDIGHPDEPLGQNVRLNWQLEGRGKLASEAGVLAYWAMLPLAGYGAVSLARRRVPLSPLIAVVVVIVVTAAATLGVTRYRVPLDLVVVVLAAAGADALLSRRAAQQPESAA